MTKKYDTVGKLEDCHNYMEVLTILLITRGHTVHGIFHGFWCNIAPITTISRYT